MALFFYALYALAHGVLTVMGLLTFRRTRRTGVLLTALVAVGLVYDNLIQAIGGLIGYGGLLRSLNWLRFGLHQWLLPGVIVSAYELARCAGHGWAQHPAARWLAWAAALATAILGSLTRLVGLQLVPEEAAGVIRYAPDKVLGPPLASILSIGAVAAVAAGLWRKNRWPWLFLVSVLVFLAEAGLRNRTLRLVVGGGLEVVFIGALLAADQWLERRSE